MNRNHSMEIERLLYKIAFAFLLISTPISAASRWESWNCWDASAPVLMKHAFKSDKGTLPDAYRASFEVKRQQSKYTSGMQLLEDWYRAVSWANSEGRGPYVGILPLSDRMFMLVKLESAFFTDSAHYWIFWHKSTPGNQAWEIYKDAADIEIFNSVLQRNLDKLKEATFLEVAKAQDFDDSQVFAGRSGGPLLWNQKWLNASAVLLTEERPPEDWRGLSVNSLLYPDEVKPGRVLQMSQKLARTIHEKELQSLIKDRRWKSLRSPRNLADF